MAFLLLIACGKPSAIPPATPNPNGPRVVLPDGTVILVEIAADDASRQQGMMYRDRVREGTGMLFLFQFPGHYPFWMKNTLIPLDIIWLDGVGTVVHVKEGVPPCQADPCPSYPPGVEARYVLELGSGVARQHKVTPGTMLRLEGMTNVIIR